MTWRAFRLIGVGLIGMGLATGCCCFESGHCPGKAFHRCSEMAWNGSGGGECCNRCAANGCTGVGCGCSCHGCGLLGPAMGWCPDYPAMAAGWTPCCGPIVNFFVGLRNAFATCGCGGCGPLYLDEWYNDPPACQDPCPDAYGPSGSCGCGSCGGGEVSGEMGESFPVETWPGEFDGPGAPAGSCNCDQPEMSARPSLPSESVGPPRTQRISHQPARPGRRRPVTTVSHQDQRAPRQGYRYPRNSDRREQNSDEVRRVRPAPPPSDDGEW